MTKINVLNKDGMKEYKNKVFNKDGYDTLKTYTCTLIKLYFKTKKYPFKLGILLGLPMMQYAQIIESKEKLNERIKSYMHILGLNELEVNVDGKKIKMNYKVEQ